MAKKVVKKAAKKAAKRPSAAAQKAADVERRLAKLERAVFPNGTPLP